MHFPNDAIEPNRSLDCVPPQKNALPPAIFFLDRQFINEVYGPSEMSDISCQARIIGAPVTAEIYAGSSQTWPEVEMLFSGWGSVKYDEEFLQRFPKLKIIFYAAGSIKSLVTDAFWQRGIRITSSYSANAVPVAEYTCAQIICALKQIWQQVFHLRKHKKYPSHFRPPGAFGTTVGLLSLGMIGRKVAIRLQGSDLRVIAYDPFISKKDAAELGVELVSLEEVFARSEVISCHTPWLPQTENMIRGGHFRRMKPQATFINTARGAVIHEPEMIAVLQERPDILAILDVAHPEPPGEGSALYTLDNVILTPHIAGSLGEECRRMGRYMVGELERYLNGRPLLYEISEQEMSTMA